MHFTVNCPVCGKRDAHFFNIVECDEVAAILKEEHECSCLPEGSPIAKQVAAVAKRAWNEKRAAIMLRRDDAYSDLRAAQRDMDRADEELRELDNEESYGADELDLFDSLTGAA